MFLLHFDVFCDLLLNRPTHSFTGVKEWIRTCLPRNPTDERSLLVWEEEEEEEEMEEEFDTDSDEDDP